MLTFLVPAAIVALIVAWFAWFIEDWRRDFTQNYASTSPEAADPRLRPLATELSPAEAETLVRRAAETLPRWQAAGRTGEGNLITLAFVRTTPLMRFKDDVKVHLQPTPEGCTISAESRSRVGKGDLGQNPRNLREIMTAVRVQLAAASPSPPSA